MIILAAAHSILLFALAFLIYKRQHVSLKVYFWPALFVKLGAGIALGFLYRHYYTEGGDTITYFNDAVKLATWATHHFTDYLHFLWNSDMQLHALELNYTVPRALFLSKTASVFSLFTNHNYWIISSYFSFLSFLGSWFLISVLHKVYSDISAAVVAFLFFPSIVFWTSGLIKESLAMACLFFLTAVFLKLYESMRLSWWQWLLIPFSLWMLWNLKYYYLAVFLPIVATTLVMRFLIKPRVQFATGRWKYVVWMVIFTIPLYVASIVHPNFYPERFLSVIVTNYNAFIALSSPGDAIVFPGLKAEPWSIIKYFPKAIFSAIYRPFIGEASNLFQWIAAIENALLMLLSFAFAYRVIAKKTYRMSALVFPLLVYILLLSAFLALSTPNFGTLSRYRVGFLPFLVLLICYNNPLLTVIRPKDIEEAGRLNKK